MNSVSFGFVIFFFFVFAVGSKVFSIKTIIIGIVASMLGVGLLILNDQSFGYAISESVSLNVPRRSAGLMTTLYGCTLGLVFRLILKLLNLGIWKSNK
tara:strand:+ start:1808 stop:2101 length:294 start_codon:yes stop_codon:yes gene_type:complete